MRKKVLMRCSDLRMNKITKEDIKEWILPKIQSLHLENIGLRKFWLAGSSLRPNEEIHDFDIYPTSNNKIRLTKPPDKKTKNALTYIVNNKKVQICNYSAESLGELVEDFDFAHVKLGAEFSSTTHKSEENPLIDFDILVWEITEIYISRDFRRCENEGNFYCPETRSDPIDSLFRSYKYYKRGLLKPRDVIVPIILEWAKRNDLDVSTEDAKIKDLMPT